jgi:hypothetical protein
MAQQSRQSLMGVAMRLYGSFAGRVVTVPSVPGLEWTFPENRMHYGLPINRMHCTMPENRMHYTMPEED